MPSVSMVNGLVDLFILILVARAVLDNLNPTAAGWEDRGRISVLLSFRRIVTGLTEPALAPIRARLPKVAQGLDLSPLVAVIVLDLVGRFVTFILTRR